MIWGPVGAMLSLLPQFEGILLALLAVFFLAGGVLALLLGNHPLRPIRWLPPGLCLMLLAAGEILWHTSGSGGQGEGTRAAAAMIAFIALPALLGTAAVWLYRRIRRKSTGDTQTTTGRRPGK